MFEVVGQTMGGVFELLRRLIVSRWGFHANPDGLIACYTCRKATTR